MQQKPPVVEENLIDEMERLIVSIKKRENNIQDKDLAKRLGYRPGYISECRSKNKVSEKFVNILKNHLQSLENASQQTTDNLPTIGKDGKNITVDDLRDLMSSNKTLADANKELAIANRKLVDDHSELVQLAKQAFNISLEKLGQVVSVPIPQDEVSNQKAYEDLPLGTGHVVRKKHSPYS